MAQMVPQGLPALKASLEPMVPKACNGVGDPLEDINNWR